MGAVDFTAFGSGADHAQAYAIARETAFHEHGHYQYNGTVTTTNGYRVHVDTPMSYDEALRVARESLANDEYAKWGPAGAIPIAGKGEIEGWLFFGIAAE